MKIQPLLFPMFNSKIGEYCERIEIQTKILEELKKLNSTITDIYAAIEGQHELLMNKLSALDSIVEKIKQNT